MLVLIPLHIFNDLLNIEEPADAVEYGTLDADLQRVLEIQAAEIKKKAEKEKAVAAAAAPSAPEASCKLKIKYTLKF